MALPMILTTEDDQGMLVVGFYVQLTEGFVSLAILQQAVEVRTMKWSSPEEPIRERSQYNC